MNDVFPSVSSLFTGYVLSAFGQNPNTSDEARLRLHNAARAADAKRLAEEMKSVGKNNAGMLSVLRGELGGGNPPAGFEFGDEVGDDDDPVSKANKQARRRLLNALRYGTMAGSAQRHAAELGMRAGNITSLRDISPDAPGMPHVTGVAPAPTFNWADYLSRIDDPDEWRAEAKASLTDKHNDGWLGFFSSGKNRAAARAYVMTQEGGEKTAALLGFLDKITIPTAPKFEKLDAQKTAKLWADLYVEALADGDVESYVNLLNDLADEKEDEAVGDIASLDARRALRSARIAEGTGSDKTQSAKPGTPGGAEAAGQRARDLSLIAQEIRGKRSDANRDKQLAEWYRSVAKAAQESLDESDAERGEAIEQHNVVVPRTDRELLRELYNNREWGDGRTAEETYKFFKNHADVVKAMIPLAEDPETRARAIQRYREIILWTTEVYPDTAKENARRIRDAKADWEISKKLNAPVTMDFFNTPLSDLMEWLQDSTKVKIVLDKPAIADEGVTGDTPVTIHAQNIPLKSTLKLILGEFNLTYLTKDGVIHITTRTLIGDAKDIAPEPVILLLNPINGREYEESLGSVLVGTGKQFRNVLLEDELPTGVSETDLGVLVNMAKRTPGAPEDAREQVVELIKKIGYKQARELLKDRLQKKKTLDEMEDEFVKTQSATIIAQKVVEYGNKTRGMIFAATKALEGGAYYSKELKDAADAERKLLEYSELKRRRRLADEQGVGFNAIPPEPSSADTGPLAMARAGNIVLGQIWAVKGRKPLKDKTDFSTTEPEKGDVVVSQLSELDFKTMAALDFKSRKEIAELNIFPTVKEIDEGMRRVLHGNVATGVADPTESGSVNATQLLAAYNTWVVPLQKLMGRDQEEKTELPAETEQPRKPPAHDLPATLPFTGAPGETSGFPEVGPYKFVSALPYLEEIDEGVLAEIKNSKLLKLDGYQCVGCNLIEVVDGDNALWRIKVFDKSGDGRFAVANVRIAGIGTADSMATLERYKAAKKSTAHIWSEPGDFMFKAAREFAIRELGSAERVMIAFDGQKDQYNRFIGNVYVMKGGTWRDYAELMLKSTVEHPNGQTIPLAKPMFHKVPTPQKTMFTIGAERDPVTGAIPIGLK